MVPVICILMKLQSDLRTLISSCQGITTLYNQHLLNLCHYHRLRPEIQDVNAIILPAWGSIGGIWLLPMISMIRQMRMSPAVLA